MIDILGRTIDYIRISVTDRCNLRCQYCMPEEGIKLLYHEDILSYQEIIRICRAGAKLGIKKVKLTGGEPLVRKDISGLIKELVKIRGIEDVTMTSNGCLLKDMAEELKDAGLSSVNVSLDTLNPERFAKITRRDCFYQVIEGIDKAIESGLHVKINCAVMESLTSDEVLAFARFSEKKRVPIRFIEMMPIGQGQRYLTMDNDKLVEILKENYGDFRKNCKVRGNGPASYYTFGKDGGCVGFISAVHHKFCSRCNRVRLTSDGFLKLCLDSDVGVNLKTYLRNDVTDQELLEILENCLQLKPESHHFEEKNREVNLNMNQIGG